MATKVLDRSFDVHIMGLNHILDILAIYTCYVDITITSQPNKLYDEPKPGLLR